MIQVRRAGDRGHTRRPGFDSRHAFSFGDDAGSQHAGYRALRALDDILIEPKHGLERHVQADTEILHYVLQGALEHRDSLGNESVVRSGDVRRLSAGSGVDYGLLNTSLQETACVLEVRILPERRIFAPGTEQHAFPASERLGQFRLVASRDGRLGSVTIRQDADVYLAALRDGSEARHPLRPGRCAWVHVARGRVLADGESLVEGDGAGFADEPGVFLFGREPLSEVLVLDLADRA